MRLAVMKVAKRVLRKSRKRIFRVALFPVESGPYGEQAAQGIARYVQEHRHFAISIARFGEVDEQDVAAGRVDGVVIYNWNASERLRKICRKTGVPVVDISGDGGRSSVGMILPDDRLVGVRVAEYFLSRGFHHYAYYGLPRVLGTPWNDSRQSGFSAAAREAGHNCVVFESAATEWEQLHHPVLFQSLGKWLSRLPRPTGILACTDTFAYELLRAAHKNHMRVPDEIAICGVDNRAWICTLANPAISSIPLDGQKAGVAAAEMLTQMMKTGKLEAAPRLIEPQPIVHRGSTETYAYADTIVVGALNFIRDHAHQPITVESILDHLLVSRRSLEVRFKKLTGVTLQNQIWFAHVERAKKLLLESGQPMYQICENAGFQSSAVFNVVFRRLVGTSPTMFRRRDRQAAV